MNCSTCVDELLDLVPHPSGPEYAARGGQVFLEDKQTSGPEMQWSSILHLEDDQIFGHQRVDR